MDEFIRTADWLASALKPIVWIATIVLTFTIIRSYQTWREFRTDWPAGHPWNLVFVVALLLSQISQVLAPPTIWSNILSILFLIIGIIAVGRTLSDIDLLKKVARRNADDSEPEHSSQEDNHS
jgi:hypothetical protein